MKIFAIRDDAAEFPKDLAYLLYYERDKRFYIELPEDSDPWELPLLLDSFVRQGEATVNSYWSRIWVQQRIIPPDRQNINEILRDNNLDEYDEFEMLMLAMGRCAQDDYYLVPVDEGALPEEITRRFARRIEDVLPLDDYCLLVFFRDGAIKKCRLKAFFGQNREFRILLSKPEYFGNVQMQTGGYGVAWDVNMTISDSLLYDMGEAIPLTADDFRKFVSQRIINAAEAADILMCSRQNIMDLTKRGKLHPVKSSVKNTLYLKSEVLKRNWQ